MALDKHGDLGAALIPFYLPFIPLTIYLAFRHGFSRSGGWVYLCILAVMRVLAGILLVAAETITPVNVGVYIGAAILEFAGLSPLLLGTLGFVRTVVLSSYRETTALNMAFRLLYLIGILGLILSIVGGSESDTTSISTLKTSTSLRKSGAILLAVLYAILLVIHAFMWANVSKLDMHRRRLLIGISSALPFLLVRTVYSVLSTFSGSPIPGGPPNTSKLAKFNLANGEWYIYLVMGLLMEYITICIYTVVGWRTPATIQRGNDKAADADGYPLEPPAQRQNAYVAPYRV
ncbi:hypothetical protein FIBSPDRAFT_723111 [Athelia psychrophila]|uniref:DUF7702 domain-containing protein n=1 Tax=Athelia psychrophila TaxID=1759441 RepID=A0A166V5J2_9AGAM|nr:hypothetical protein FIBSPDRAFT_723111 [Fibularhizoctonia sp. CBS 109695]